MVKKAKEEETVAEPPVDLSVEDKETRRNSLITSLRELLVTKREMVVGGREVRSKHNNEQSCYGVVLEEINNLGNELGYAGINFGNIRRD